MAEPKGGVKTLAIQLTDDEHAQLVLISQVDGLSLTRISAPVPRPLAQANSKRS